MGTDDYIASIGLTGATYVPQSYSLCQGQAIAIAQNQALFSLIGDLYGGNGVSYFELPDLRGAVPVGPGQRPGSDVNLAEPGVTLEALTELSWPAGFPARVASGGENSLPEESGVAGVALNWAICLYGLYPERP